MLRGIDGFYDPNVLVGYDTADDAGVYLLDENNVLVQTMDFFTPVVDDPVVFGQIAAANSVSDVYAMGGVPRFALSVVGFPRGQLGEEVLRDILWGGAQKLKEARVAIIGGHSVQDPEIKFGYAVTGLVDRDRVYTNAGAQPGDGLVLTKPIGTGIIASGIKFGKCPVSVADAAIEWMLQLNNAGMELLKDLSIHAVTDVTGYGLIGHLFEMALGSGVCFDIEADQVPIIGGAEELAQAGMLPGGIESNRRFVADAVRWDGVPERCRQLLFDPQTSGGLLISLPHEEAISLVNRRREKGLVAALIGSASKRMDAYIRVRGSSSS